MIIALFKLYSLAELRHHPWRSALAVLAIALGVALGFAVHLINQSALSEFSQAVRSINGEPDVELRAANGLLSETIYPQVANHPSVKVASPVIELDTIAQLNGASTQDTGKVTVRVLGIDPLVAASISPGLVARPYVDKSVDKTNESRDERFALFASDSAFLTTKALKALNAKMNDTITLQAGVQLKRFRVAGTVAAGDDTPIVVMDIAAAQEQFDMLGKLTRLDVQLLAGAQWQDVQASLAQQSVAANSLRVLRPGDGQARISNLSRAYRVNLTVLALVALFTGGFLVFSIQAMSVAQRTQQLALLGILGTDPLSLRIIIFAEGLLLGIVGAILGIALGAGLALAALQLLGGDLGGGTFAGITPKLQFSWLAALVYSALGIVCALIGGWLPAQQASRMALARSLKSSALSSSGSHSNAWLPSLAAAVLITLAIVGAFLPPVFGVPLFAYLSIALLLVGGVAAVPAVVSWVLRLAPRAWLKQPVALLATQRAAHFKQQATIAICGVVASLSLAVALTVMVASFRESVTHWLDTVLPADLYVRSAALASTQSANYFSQADLQTLRTTPGVQRLEALRQTSVMLDIMPRDAQPMVLSALAIESDGADAARKLPLVGDLLPFKPDIVNVYVSEAAVDLYGMKPGTSFILPTAKNAPAYVRGVWRDYSRQFGTIVIPLADWQRLSGDDRVNDVSLWLAPGAVESDVQNSIRKRLSGGDLVQFASAREIRATSLKIFDRSFAVTVWLQALAVGIGLFGIAASFSAQVLARRKEFGMLIHLGYTRGQILKLVAAEGAAWTLVGALLGLALGIAVGAVLVHVVNPQSFHWTMDMLLPWGRLAVLCASVVVAGCVTALWAARSAAGREAVLAVRADW
jgi:putative ABC transport system permease protein